MGNISERDFNTYQKIYQMVVRTLPAPSLLVFLYAPVDILAERIKQRGRSIETGISTDYLRRLELYYHEWLQSFDLCPVLTIKTNDLDFVHKPKHFELVVKRIQEKLTGKEEMVFSE